MTQPRMPAVRLPAFATSTALEVTAVAVPAPTAARPVLVEVTAAALNPVDLKICAGRLPDPTLAEHLPLGLGYDLAGRVAATRGETGWQVGTRVCGMVGFPDHPGTLAGYALAAPDELVAVPDTVADVIAAALPLVGLTATQALVEQAQLAAGETVLITGASGGVGSLLVQLAHRLGARVIAVASGRHAARCRALGADVVLDYTAGPLARLTARIDVILHTVVELAGTVADLPGVGAHTRGVTIVSLPDGVGGPLEGTRTLVRSDAAQLARLIADVAAGALQVPVAATYPLGQVQEACALLATGHAGGKVVLRPDPAAAAAPPTG